MWSQIQRKLYDLIDPNLKLQVHCAVDPGGGRTCLNGIPRFWVKLGGEVIFDCLHDYIFMWQDKNFDIGNLPLEDDIAWCCGIVIRYFQAPVDCLMTLHDRFGLTDILLAADRRIGKRRWPEIYATRSEAAQKVLVARGYVPSSKRKFRTFWTPSRQVMPLSNLFRSRPCTFSKPKKSFAFTMPF